jgi:hypothetical protein
MEDDELVRTWGKHEGNYNEYEGRTHQGNLDADMRITRNTEMDVKRNRV